RSLDGVQAKVPANESVVILLFSPVNSEKAKSRGKICVPGDNHSRVTKSPEILTGEKRKTACVANSPRLSSLIVCGSNCLSRILNNRNAMASRCLHKRRHVCAATKKVDGKNSFGPDGNTSFYCLSRNIQRLRININKNRPCPDTSDNSG